MVTKSQAVDAHRELVRHGQYEAGRSVLYLLRTGRLACGLGDVDTIIEDALVAHGGEGRISYDGLLVRFTLAKQ